MDASSSSRPYYKVICGDQSIHGGSHTWSLPRQNEQGEWLPGEWHEVAYTPWLCSRGFHLTQEPARWFRKDATAYLAEWRGLSEGPSKAEDDTTKIAVQAVRLVRPLTESELNKCGVFVSGEHSISSGVGRAYDSATVHASDSATVRAYDSATVRAYDSATVRAYDSATVHASGSATVRASGSATVHAESQSTVIRHSLRAVVNLIGLAIEVNWTSGRAEFRRAEGELS